MTFVFLFFPNPDARVRPQSGKKKEAAQSRSLYILYLEAATGFEPVNNGFADRCLSHLAMPPVWTGAGERI